MKKTNKKGFTLVELLVVIAILAILATVAVVGYTSFMDKAHESNDRSLVAQLNTAVLRADGKYTSMHEVAEAVAANGFDVAKMQATAKDHEILWNMDTQKFFYSADEDLKGKNIWIVSDEVSSVYSTLYIGGEDIKSDTETSICVITNGTNLTINAPKADVYHAGDVANLTIEAVAGASYHEFGRVTAVATVKKGHVVVESTGSIGTLIVDTTVAADVKLSGDYGVVVATNEVLSNLTVNAEVKAPVADLEAVSSAVALIEGTFYNTLAEALAAANGKTIVLMKDVEYAANKVFTINKDQIVTIDLNGHIIAATAGDKSGSEVILNNGTLTIKDSLGNGKITTSALNADEGTMPGYANNTITNKGTLILEGGVIENTTTNAPAAYSVDCSAGSTFVMKGGELVSAFDALRLYATRGDKVVATITGGSITGTGSPIWVQPGAGSIELNITGGTFVDLGDDVWKSIHLGQQGGTMSNIEINITGGKIVGDVYISPIFAENTTIGEGVSISGKVIYDTDDNVRN